MVLSHKKLKRKRAEEEAAAEHAKEQNSVDKKDVDDTSKKREKKKKERDKPIVTEEPVLQSAHASHEDDGGAEIEKPTGGENAAKNKKKEKKKRNREANGVAAAGDEDRLSNGKLNGAVDHSGADDEQTRGNVGTASHDGNGNGVSANGVQKSENGSDKGMTVRERKGKKKKDRWGGVVEEAEVQQRQDAGDVAANTVKENEVQTEVGKGDDASGGQRYDPKKVYVGGMPYYVTEENIVDFFSECGKITELDCVLFPDTGKFRGLAFITFETVEGANQALAWDGCEMGGRFLKITKCLIKAPRSNSKSAELGEVQKHEGCLSAYIGNLSWNITEDVLKNFLKKHYKPTKIEAIRFAYDKNTGEFKGYGHIDFGDDDSLEAAVRLNQTQLLGRPVKVAYSVPKRTPPPNMAKDGGEEAKPSFCYHCGERGHKAFLCPAKWEVSNNLNNSTKFSIYNQGFAGSTSQQLRISADAAGGTNVRDCRTGEHIVNAVGVRVERSGGFSGLWKEESMIVAQAALWGIQ
ncbi:hypothetical protein R1flu_009192 [Riccia fluitans]|uniref:Uncharacterized protein n=1 Tax=Riccia fluitans TaxID=41844 RepID=A0ABD1Z1M4_9MARC